VRRDEHAMPSLEGGEGLPIPRAEIGNPRGGNPRMRRTLRDRHAQPSLLHKRERDKTPHPLQAGEAIQRWKCNPNSFDGRRAAHDEPTNTVPTCGRDGATVLLLVSPPSDTGGRYSDRLPNPPRYARRVLPRLRPGRRPVRPSRASPARRTAAPDRLRRSYAIPRAPGLSCVLRSRAGLTPGTAARTPSPTWSARSTAPRRAASACLAPSLRSVTRHA